MVELEDADTPTVAMIDPEEEKNSRRVFEQQKRVGRFSDLSS